MEKKAAVNESKDINITYSKNASLYRNHEEGIRIYLIRHGMAYILQMLCFPNFYGWSIESSPHLRGRWNLDQERKCPGNRTREWLDRRDYDYDLIFREKKKRQRVI